MQFENSVRKQLRVDGYNKENVRHLILLEDINRDSSKMLHLDFRVERIIAALDSCGFPVDECVLGRLMIRDSWKIRSDSHNQLVVRHDRQDSRSNWPNPWWNSMISSRMGFHLSII